MLDLLMYIFENYLQENSEFSEPPEIILSEMEREGFSRVQIMQAINWFVDLNQNQQPSSPASISPLRAVRHYTREEMDRLGTAGVNFLLYLERIGILDHYAREMIIERLIALEHKEINLSHLKWVALIVLFNHPDKKFELNLLQDLILQDVFEDEKKH